MAIVGIGTSEDHVELARVVRAYLERHDALAAARAALEGTDPSSMFWKDLGELGWLGLHIPEDAGGSGYGLAELVVVAQELGRACTPGPFLPTVVAAGAIAAAGTDEQRRSLAAPMAIGDWRVGLGAGRDLQFDERGCLDGLAGPVMCGSDADYLAVTVGDDLVLIDPRAAGVRITPRVNLDPTRPCVSAQFERVEVTPGQIVSGGAGPARRLLAVVASAEASGGSTACRMLAAEYARTREAFGRPIGQFQAVKHHCANMLIAERLAEAAVWDAARGGGSDALADAAVVEALPAYLRCAQTNIQVHGGIGFTWEHDAQLFLRRASSLMALVGELDERRRRLATVGFGAAELSAGIELPAEADTYREQARQFAAAYWNRPESERHQLVVDEGYLFPHWPRPWGREAGPIEQIVIEEELADVPRMAPLGPTGWTLAINLPTFMEHATEEQQARWIEPTLRAEVAWCQLLSEPGAGSDLASLTTRATRVEEGWSVSGQKVWTSSAHQADLGFALVRTDPQAAKHAGLTCMVIDMKAQGITIRPLRQLTGEAEFNEVFLDEVFVPDADIVGAVGDGWLVTRTSLENERVSLGQGTWAPTGARRAVIDLAQQRAAEDQSVAAAVGDLVARDHAITALNLRAASHAVAGLTAKSGGEGALAKLARAEYSQGLAELAFGLAGADAVFSDGDMEAVGHFLLQSRAATIAGGTSEIVRNVLAERVLGLPRDPRPTPPSPPAARTS